MQIEVNMTKSGRWVEASVPAVRVYTQGKSFKDAAAMVVDAVELLADTYGIKAKAFVKRTPGVGWALGFDSDAALIAFVLKRHRRERGISVERAAKAIGQRSNQAIVAGADGRAFAIGGGNFGTVTRAVQVYDPKRGTWVAGPP